MNLRLKLFLLFLLHTQVMAAQFTVVDSELARPIPGATVQFTAANGAEAAVGSDADGRFSLPVETKGPVRVSAIGHKAVVFNLDTLPSGSIALPVATYALRQAVVTGQYGLRNDADVVQPVQVIDRRQIERIGAVSLRDVLLTQSTLNIGHDSQLGTNIQMLGLSGQHVQILVDGLPVIGRLDGNIDLDQLPLDNVIRIEVIEGPMSVEYGSEAIAGTINLITRGSSTETASVRTVAESVGRFHGMSNFRQNIGSNWQLDGRASRLYFDGFNPPERSGRDLQWKPKEQYAASLGLTRRFGNLNLAVSGDHLFETLWNDGPVQYLAETRPINDSLVGVYNTPFARDGVFITRRTVGRIDVNGEALNGRIDGFAAFNHYRRDRQSFTKDLVNLTNEPLLAQGMNDTALFATWHSRLSYVRRFSDDLNASIGYDVSHETASGERIDDGQREMTNLALFASLEWKPSKNLVVRPGLRAVDNSVFGAPLVPSLHLKWSRKSHTLRASYARGFRAPELKELYFFFVDFNHNIRGTEDLMAELSNSWQAGYEYRKLTERAVFSPSIRVFHNEVFNLIDLSLLDAETQLYQYVNLGRVLTSGATFAVRRSGERLSVNLQTTALERKTWFDSESDAAVTNRSVQGNLAFDYNFEKGTTLTAQINHTHNEAITQSDANGELVQAELSPFTNASAFVAQKLFQGRVVASAGVDNLFDTTARTISGEVVNSGGAHSQASGSQPVAMGRNFRFTLQWNIQ